MIIGPTDLRSAEADSGKGNRLACVLITPARNEEAFLEETIKSVIRQTVLPKRWVIVSDGSTDRTDEIVRKYSSEFPWIELIVLPERAERHFAGKVHAFDKGLERVRGIDYDIIGNLDADISFEDRDYFAFLLEKFVEDVRLGVGGTPFREGSRQYDYRFSRKEHVSGACQLFRRQCFEAIGGYVPMKAGAIDLVAVVTARMKGWKTETFTEKYCRHHRRMGTAKQGIVQSLLKSGYGDYLVGVHPLWQFFRSVYQMSRRPLIVGGGCLLSGYIWAAVRRAPKPVSTDFVRFRRKEQMQWLQEYLVKGLRRLKFA